MQPPSEAPKEIGEKKVITLEPSSQFGLGLHQGLFHRKFSPVADDYVGMTASPECLNCARHHIEQQPIPPHNFDLRKAKILPLYNCDVTRPC
jgi:hypothetical protein